MDFLDFGLTLGPPGRLPKFRGGPGRLPNFGAGPGQNFQHNSGRTEPEHQVPGQAKIFRRLLAGPMDTYWRLIVQKCFLEADWSENVLWVHRPTKFWRGSLGRKFFFLEAYHAENEFLEAYRAEKVLGQKMTFWNLTIWKNT